MRILLVDDSVTLRKIVLRSLHKHGYNDIDEAADGQEAIDLLKMNEYECIFLDINMPRVDGLEVLAWLAISDKHSKLHIVVMSTEVMHFSPQKILELGIDTVIPKPFTAIEFEKAAISLLNIIESVEGMTPLVYDGPILIVEDNMTMRTILRKQLFHLNCLNVEEAHNGKEGLEKINEWVMLDTGDEKLGIVFLDLVMPVMDGMGLIEILEQKQLLHKLHIVVVSGEIDMALDMVDGVTIMAALPKPFVHEEFIKAFRPLVDTTRTACINPMINKQLFLDNVLSELEPIDIMSIDAANIEDFCSTLFEPFNSIVSGMPFPKKRSQKISKEIFTFFVESVYRPILTIDHNASLYHELIHLYDKLCQIDQYEEAIRAISDDALTEYCKRILVAKDPEYMKVIKEKNSCTLSIMKLTEEESELKSEYETSQSDAIKEAYEKGSEELANCQTLLETHDNTLKELKKTLAPELYAACHERISLQLYDLKVIADQMRAAFDRSLWRRMRTSTDYREYLNCSNRHVELSTEHWLSDEGLLDAEVIKNFFKDDYRHTIVIIGFNAVDGKDLQHNLIKLFPSYTIYVHTSLFIQNLLIPYLPSLFIFNREEKVLNIESFVQDTANHFEVTPNEINTLILYYRPFSGDEILAKNSIYNLKLKNYMKFPKNKQDFTLMSIKIKSLLF
ncbi:MAG TPA: response regulator [Sulfuricurvum sp.]|nr:MAG: hypothetical protein B7Y30_02545 [Campylobacterales bacterium 16-40-21]OZA04156.1 MAG: hypothetical protein B7X89_00970 [Sulfuricurvum sp. 17-40-25]HQS66165.1 response regulator [Sulfuricurvum sp.]HQT35529.1 response regulator [Sulfuricurvum sp.]